MTTTSDASSPTQTWLNLGIVGAAVGVIVLLLATSLLQGAAPAALPASVNPVEPLLLERNAYLAEIPRYERDAWAQWRADNPGERAAYPTHINLPALGLDSDLLGVTLDQNGLIWAPPRNAGHFLYSGRPGEGTNIVMVGHSGSGLVFERLLAVEIGQRISVQTEAGTHHYTVTQTQVVAVKGADAEQLAANVDFVQPTASEQLTLVTCWPRDAYTHRLIVQAVPEPQSS